MGIPKTIAVIAIIIILLIFARGCMSGCGQQSSQPKVPENIIVPEKTVYDCLEIINKNGEYDSYYGHLTVTGTIKNSCPKGIEFVHVCITAYDGTTSIGNTFAYASGPNYGVSAYGQSTFKTITLLDISPEKVTFSAKICDGRFG